MSGITSGSAVGALDIWHKCCAYLYLPRLRDADVLRQTLGAGAGSRDFFGFAYGRDGDRYLGFTFGKATSPILDDSLLLVEVKEAERFDALFKAEIPKPAEPLAGGATPTQEGTPNTQSGGAAPAGSPTALKAAKKRVFFGTVELNPNQPKPQFGDVVDEIVMLLNRPDVRLKISVEIEAESEGGFDDNVQRAVRENCNQLKFKNGGFED